MTGKTSDKTQSCFSFPYRYSLSLQNTCTEDSVSAGFTVEWNTGGFPSITFTQPTASSYN